MKHARAFSYDERRFKDARWDIGEMPVIGRVTRNASNCPLDTYDARGFITGPQHEAGTRFARDCYVAGATPMSRAGFERVDAGTSVIGEPQVIATRRMRGAMREMGLLLTSVAIDVCVLDMTAEAWAKKQNHSRQWGMARFKDALDVLVEYYQT